VVFGTENYGFSYSDVCLSELYLYEFKKSNNGQTSFDEMEGFNSDA
jgi:hypothetical protein